MMLFLDVIQTQRVSLCNPDWLDRVKLGYVDDPNAMQILSNPTGEYSVKGVIRYQGFGWA